MNKKKTSWTGLSRYALALPLFAFLLLSGYAWSVTSALVKQDTTSKTKTTTKSVSKDDEKVFTEVEQLPVFPGGEAALMKFLSTNIHYPLSAAEKGIEGRVILRFIVRKTGEVSDVEVIRGLSPDCDQEAIRVISMMPKWTPGRQNGRDVSVYFTIPIKFMLDHPGEVKTQLVIIDGVESTHEAIRTIKPEDIESFNILNDSSAVANYGQKGKNGVIIVKMKK